MVIHDLYFGQRLSVVHITVQEKNKDIWLPRNIRHKWNGKNWYWLSHFKDFLYIIFGITYYTGTLILCGLA